MSLRHSKHNINSLGITVYDFDKVGDILPMHSHDESTAHITIVARGSVLARGAGWERELHTGAVVDFPPNQEHEFTALVDNTRLVNISKDGCNQCSL